ncbi:MAG: hypothetical protein IJR07_06900 [Bacteroidaceae bacterium]|nr:hypothetical protein [Bacteroidaceae bacterium]
MFWTFLIYVLVAFMVGYGLMVAFDMFLMSRQDKDNEEVVIDITPTLVNYVPMDASEVVNKEEKQNIESLELGDTWESMTVGMDENGMEDEREEELFNDLSEGDEDDYTPMNMSEEYDPLEFKKILEDSYKAPNLFSDVFHNEVEFEEGDNDDDE